MILNEIGQIAHNEWMKTPEIRNNVELGEFIVMPDHFHGIIKILRRGELHSPSFNSNELNISSSNSNELNISLNNSSELHSEELLGEFNSPRRSPSQTIGAIIRGYKSSVTKQLNNLGLSNKNEPLWQRNYYEHIIRDEEDYQRITQYIKNNPAKWGIKKQK
jgi:REP element-mobilizing transposase RayT